MLYNVIDNYGYFATYELLEENLPEGMDWEEAVDLVQWQESTQVSSGGEYATIFKVSYAMADEADIVWDKSNLQAIIAEIENLEGDLSTPEEACAVVGSPAWLKGIQLLYVLSETGLLDEQDYYERMDEAHYRAAEQAVDDVKLPDYDLTREQWIEVLAEASRSTDEIGYYTLEDIEAAIRDKEYENV